ncbi:MAG: hypothetical protein HYX24_00945 [Candidatus Aenigmarchaeota archaeon]|nr:hypothetical protein [Candidatus Aenigmarchaeota archaeon]
MAGLLLISSIAVITVANDVTLNADVNNTAPTVMKWETDETNNITSINPTPGQPVTVRKCAIVCDNNGKEDIVDSTVKAVVQFPNGTVKEQETLGDGTGHAEHCGLGASPDFGVLCKFYSGTFLLASTDPSLNYSITVTAKDVANEEGMDTNNLTYGTCTGVSLSSSTITFGQLAPGTTASGTEVTITNTCNTEMDIADSVTDLTRTTSPPDTIPASDVTETIAGVPASSTCTNVNIAVGGTATMTSSLIVPLGTLPGTYTGTKTLTALNGATC